MTPDLPHSFSAQAPTRTKAEWRVALLKQRLAMADDQRSRAQALIMDHLSTLAILQEWRRVLVFLPWKAEPDLMSLWKMWHLRGLQLGLAVVVERSGPMRLTAWTPGQPLLTDLMGLPVPDASASPAEEFDTWVLPCIGIDATGARIGAGKGFYDRTISDRDERGLSRPRIVGVCYQQALIPESVGEAHDLRLQLWVTEAGYGKPGQPWGAAVEGPSTADSAES